MIIITNAHTNIIIYDLFCSFLFYIVLLLDNHVWTLIVSCNCFTIDFFFYEGLALYKLAFVGPLLH